MCHRARMQVSRIAVTGSAGAIGRVLLDGLGRDIVPLDLPSCDVRDADAVAARVAGVAAVVHLAWDMRENYDTAEIVPDNIAMARAVIAAVAIARVPRLVVASSVHAGRFGDTAQHNLPVTVAESAAPASRYGQDKRLIERLVQEGAADGLDAVAVRLGGVRPSPPLQPYERQAWISPGDCVAAFAAALDAAVVPGRYVAYYAIGRNKPARFSSDNPFGWRAVDGAGHTSRAWRAARSLVRRSAAPPGS